MKEQIFSNLVMENAFADKLFEKGLKNSEVYSESNHGELKISRVCIGTERDARKYNCPPGRHVTAYMPRLWSMGESELRRTAAYLSEELGQILKATLGRESLGGASVLAVGIGNRSITSDALGPLTAEKINVTRHLSLLDVSIKMGGMCTVSAFACGVMGETGIRSLELVRGVVEQTAPDAVIAVDSLAARECARLASTVQISDGGIAPGAGIGNLQYAINREALGIPVVAIGVPTVVSASSLVCEAMKKCGISSHSEAYGRASEEGRAFFVAPKECDVAVENASLLIADTVNLCLGGI